MKKYFPLILFSFLKITPTCYNAPRMKLVSNQLGPNFTFSDALYALGCGILPMVSKTNFSPYFETTNFKLASTARTLLGLLADIVPDGKKVGIPAICCAVMATPFLAKGKEICWLDTDETGLLDVKEVEKHVSELGLLLVPHTFGQRVNMAKILQIARANNIILVEDGAHLFEPGQPQSDYKLFSFGREKDISCVSGGALLWGDNALGCEKIKNACLQNPSRMWVFRHAFQPLILALSLPWWKNGGRYIAGIFSKTGILPRAVTKGEKSGMNDVPETKLALTQQKILSRAIRQRRSELSHREALAPVWKRKLSEIFPKATIIVPENSFRVIVIGIDRETLLKTAQKNGFDLNEWDGDPIAPRGVDLKKFGYKPGQCPNAEKFIKNYITFPTNRRTALTDIERFSSLFETK